MALRCAACSRWLRAGRAAPPASSAAGAVSGLPVPRFVSLKSDRVNVRGGPNKDQDVRWVYTRAGMPVEITAEFENWRRIRDSEGAEGWVYHSLLSGKRTARGGADSARTSWCRSTTAPDAEAAVVAHCKPGVLGTLKSLHRHLVPSSPARASTAGSSRTRLWGVYPNEKVE